MNSKNKSQKKDMSEQQVVQGLQKKPYITPQLTIHGTMEKITGNTGLLLTDTLLTGSIL